MLRVKKALANRCDDAHERAGIGFFAISSCVSKAMCWKTSGLMMAWLGFSSDQRHERAGAADDSLRRRNHADGESQFAQRFQLLRLRVNNRGPRETRE